MKKTIIIATVLALGISILYIKDSKADYLDTYMVSQNSRYVNNKQKDKAKKYCVVTNFNSHSCGDACSEYKKLTGDNLSICDILKNPPQINSAVTTTTVAPKNIKINPLTKLKSDRSVQRQNLLAGLKQTKADLINNFKEKFTTEKCAVINARVQEKTTAFDAAGAKHTQVYTNMISRIAKFISSFDAAKLDTATIKSHEEELKTKIDKFREDYAAYITKLKETKTLTCGHSEGEFKGTLLEAKTLLQTVHDDAADIRTYTRETILVDIKALKEQMPKEQVQTDGTDVNNQ